MATVATKTATTKTKMAMTTMTTTTTMTRTTKTTMTMTTMMTTTTTATTTVTAAMMMTMLAAAAAPFVASTIGWSLHCSPPPAAIVVTHCTLSCDCCIVVHRPISSSPANVRYSIPPSLRCPQMLLSPAAAHLFHSRRWLVVASSFATHFHCRTPSLPCCPQTLSLPAATLSHSR